MRLEDWYWFGKMICGKVYGSPEFPDGSDVTTSDVAIYVTAPPKGTEPYIVTRNSTYTLGKENEESIKQTPFGDIG